MLSVQACREILASAGASEMDDDHVEYLRYVLSQVARLHLMDQFGIEASLPPKPLGLPMSR